MQELGGAGVELSAVPDGAAEEMAAAPRGALEPGPAGVGSPSVGGGERVPGPRLRPREGVGVGAVGVVREGAGALVDAAEQEQERERADHGGILQARGVGASASR